MFYDTINENNLEQIGHFHRSLGCCCLTNFNIGGNVRIHAIQKKYENELADEVVPASCCELTFYIEKYSENTRKLK